MARVQTTAGPVAADRKRRGDYATPPPLVELVVEHAVGTVAPGTTVRVLDPACGDGRFLAAAARRISALGGHAELHGVDIAADAVRAASAQLATEGIEATIELDDALARDWSATEPFDVVVGNPPYLSQLAAATTRGRASSHGGGPYADASAEFLAVAVGLARAAGGRVGLVLPQSILAARDAGPVRQDVSRLADITWSWWSPERLFDAEVIVCALVLTRRAGTPPAGATSWAHVVTSRLGVPPLPPLAAAGSLGDRARLSADFRDHYYGLVPAVVGGGCGSPLITSGLVDPGLCRWGARPVTFARQRIARPTVELDRLSAPMRAWAAAMLVPKVLIANQTRVVEAVADTAGVWLPAVPLVTARVHDAAETHAVAAVLTSPVATAWAWHRAAGTGLSATAVRLGPRWLAELPWPAGDLAPAVRALAGGDIVECGRAVAVAHGLTAADIDALTAWWAARLPGPR